MFRWKDYIGWRRDALVQSLMWTCLIEEQAIHMNDSPEMVITQDQNMVQAFAPNGADEPFAACVRFRSIGWRVDEFDPGTRDGAFKLHPILVIVIADEKAGDLRDGVLARRPPGGLTSR